jgi:hypothetical protein
MCQLVFRRPGCVRARLQGYVPEAELALAFLAHARQQLRFFEPPMQLLGLQLLGAPLAELFLTGTQLLPQQVLALLASHLGFGLAYNFFT